MAYGTKYKITFDNYFGKAVELRIQERDYGGSESYFTGSDNSIVIEWTKKSEEKYEQVVFSSFCKVTILVTTKTTVFSELFTTDRKKYRAQVYLDSVLYWTGFGANTNYKRKFTKPSSIEIMFTDGLGQLQKEQFSELITGKHRLSEFVGGAMWALNGMDLNLPLYEAINVYEENQDSGEGDSMLYQTWKESADFYGLSYYEVLERILKGCRICQRWGAWWVIRVSEMRDEEIVYRKWDSEFNMALAQAPNSNSAEDLRLDITEGVTAQNVMNVFINQSNVEMSQPGWKRVDLKLHYGYNGNLIKNYTDFTNNGGINYNTNDNRLTISGGDIVHDNKKYIRYYLGNIEEAIGGMQFQVIDGRRRVFLKGTTQRLKLTFKGVAQGNIRMRFNIDSDAVGEEFWLADTDDDNGYRPIATGTEYIINEAYSERNSEFSFEIITDVLKGNHVHPNFGDITPYPADLYLYIYQPTRLSRPGLGHVHGKVAMNFEDFKVEIISEVEGVPELKEISVEVNADSSEIADEDMYVGDSNNCPNDEVIYNSILYRKDGATYYPTQLWKRRGSDSAYTFQNLLLQDLVYEYGEEWVLCSGILKSYALDICKLLVAPDYKLYMVAGARHDLKYEEWNVTLFELRQDLSIVTESTESAILTESTESAIIVE